MTHPTTRILQDRNGARLAPVIAAMMPTTARIAADTAGVPHRIAVSVAVAHYVRLGDRTNRQIAETLKVTTRTVERHRAQLKTV